MEEKPIVNAANYDDDSIVTLEGLEHIRHRPGMYIGTLGDGTEWGDGIYFLLKEVIDNSIDEFTMGFGKEIVVEVNETTASVRDYGRGIPLGSVIKATSCLNTGGRFDDSIFQKSIGQNGVGTKAVNALSTEFYVCSYRNGECSWASFSKGVLLDSGRGPTTEKNGTFVKFTPDKEMFMDYYFHLDLVEKMVKIFTYLKVCLTITYNGTPYTSKRGLLDWIDDIIIGSPLYPPIHLEGEDIEVVLSHSSGSGVNLVSSVNGQYTYEGGTHLNAFKEAIAKAMIDFYKKNYTPDDCRQGIVGVIYLHMQEPIFDSQRKKSLQSTFMWMKEGQTGPTVRSFVNDFIGKELDNYLHIHKDIADAIEKKVKESYKLREEINAVKTRNKASKATSVYNENLRDCRVHYGTRTSKEMAKYIDQTSIFITEGKSASGTITNARNPNFQAVFSIRGKSKNSYRSSDAKVLENVELRNLVAALGIGDGLSGLRYNKVIIASDADDDGMHIRMLLITFFLKYYQELIRDGHLYILETPLFRVKTKKQNRYCYSQEERNAAIAELSKSKEKVEITRFKGLGEINEKEFKDFIGENIRLEQIVIDEAEDIQALLEFFMGNNTFERQQFIMRNLRSQDEIEGVGDDDLEYEEKNES
ncbi:MAG: type IIA DNA topoisomerase subunit B [Bacteroidales bacterium]|nr:type IIA DNA topoisomerase subunit B [Bacteroidales bacterium]